MSLINFLKGKKTYIIAILTIALGFLQGNIEMIMGGLGMMTIRAGISKV